MPLDAYIVMKRGISPELLHLRPQPPLGSDDQHHRHRDRRSTPRALDGLDDAPNSIALHPKKHAVERIETFPFLVDDVHVWPRYGDGVSIHRECDGDAGYDEMAALVRAWCTRVFGAPADDAYFAAYGVGDGLWSASPADYENEKPLDVIGRSVTDLVADIVGSRERAVRMVHAYVAAICLDNLPSDLTIEVDNNILFRGNDSSASRIFPQESSLLDTLCTMDDWARGLDD